MWRGGMRTKQKSNEKKEINRVLNTFFLEKEKGRIDVRSYPPSLSSQPQSGHDTLSDAKQKQKKNQPISYQTKIYQKKHTYQLQQPPIWKHTPTPPLLTHVRVVHRVVPLQLLRTRQPRRRVVARRREGAQDFSAAPADVNVVVAVRGGSGGRCAEDFRRGLGRGRGGCA